MLYNTDGWTTAAARYLHSYIYLDSNTENTLLYLCKHYIVAGHDNVILSMIMLCNMLHVFNVLY